jgi:hypothetical protein
MYEPGTLGIELYGKLCTHFAILLSGILASLADFAVKMHPRRRENRQRGIQSLSLKGQCHEMNIYFEKV